MVELRAAKELGFGASRVGLSSGRRHLGLRRVVDRRLLGFGIVVGEPRAPK